MFAPGKPLQDGKSLRVRQEPTHVKHLQGRLLALPINNRLVWKRFARSKHSSLLRKFVTYDRKFFITLAPDFTYISLKNFQRKNQNTLAYFPGASVRRFVSLTPAAPECDSDGTVSARRLTVPGTN